MKQFVEKYGTVTHFEYFDGRKPEKGQRYQRTILPYCFVGFSKFKDAEAFVDMDQELTLQGRPLKINFKMKKIKL